MTWARVVRVGKKDRSGESEVRSVGIPLYIPLGLKQLLLLWGGYDYQLVMLRLLAMGVASMGHI